MKAKATQNQTMVQFHASFQTSLNIFGFTSSSSRSQKETGALINVYCSKKGRGELHKSFFFFLISLLLCLLLCSFLFLLFLRLFFPCVYSSCCCRGHSTVVKPLAKISLALQNCPSSTDYCSQENFCTAWPIPWRYSSLLCFTKGLKTPNRGTVEFCLLYSPVEKKILAPCFMGSLYCSSPVHVYSQWPRRWKPVYTILALLNTWGNVCWLQWRLNFHSIDTRCEKARTPFCPIILPSGRFRYSRLQDEATLSPY